MIISDLNYLEVADAKVAGGFSESDYVNIDFNTTNKFTTIVNSPTTYSNSAAAGAKGVATGSPYVATYSFTKADTLAVTSIYDGSFSASTSVAVINAAYRPW